LAVPGRVNPDSPAVAATKTTIPQIHARVRAENLPPRAATARTSWSVLGVRPLFVRRRRHAGEVETSVTR
jgi:hypothetical protein